MPENKKTTPPSYKTKTIQDHALILLGVMTAISLVVIILDILYEMSYIPSMLFDRTAFANGSRALLEVYQNTFFGEGWARFMVTILMMGLFAGIGSMVFFYVKDLAVLIREVYKGAYKAAKDTGDVLKETAVTLNPFNVDPLTGEMKPKAEKKPAAKKPNKVDFKPGNATSFKLSEEELDKALTDPNYVPSGAKPVTPEPSKPTLFDDK